MTDSTQHVVDPKFTYTDKRSGKPVVLYQGLVDAAHRAGLLAMTTTILQYPSKENGETCIVHARATFPEAGRAATRTYDGIGDANPANVGKNIAPHYIRMAETRAKARALRDALNVGMVTVEELGGEEAEAPYTAPEYRAVLEAAWTMVEDGETAKAITRYLAAHKGRMTARQYREARDELVSIEAKCVERDRATTPAGYAG